MWCALGHCSFTVWSNIIQFCSIWLNLSRECNPEHLRIHLCATFQIHGGGVRGGVSWFWIMWPSSLSLFVFVILSFLLCTVEFSPFSCLLGPSLSLCVSVSLCLCVSSPLNVSMFASLCLLPFSVCLVPMCVRPHVLLCVSVYFLCYLHSLSSCVQCV